jgi:prepilin-type N-terminal cleavage/methylation domain-containing protein
LTKQADHAEAIAEEWSAFLMRTPVFEMRWAMRKAAGFTLVEILIVVVILGILAGVVIPLAAKSAHAAKESALAHDLHMLRRYILVYKGQHLEVPPGYPNGARDQAPTEQAFIDQIATASNEAGQTATAGTPGFDLGPVLICG